MCWVRGGGWQDIFAKNKMLMRAATVVQVLHGLFYVLLQLLIVAAIILSFAPSFIVVVIPPLLL